ncbi:MAG: hypothetical protein ACK5AZ_13960 [Bryobacteraceae bacterium]
MRCKICTVRRPRRRCPGVEGDICTVCCGTEREVTVSCPLNCEYLIQAHQYERLPEIDPSKVPNVDIPITNSFLRDHDYLIAILMGGLLEAALDTPGAVDNDVREALDSLTRTYRTLQSGLVYESTPQNPIAAAIHTRVQEHLAKVREVLSQQFDRQIVRDADVLGALYY